MANYWSFGKLKRVTGSIVFNSFSSEYACGNTQEQLQESRRLNKANKHQIVWVFKPGNQVQFSFFGCSLPFGKFFAHLWILLDLLEGDTTLVLLISHIT